MHLWHYRSHVAPLARVMDTGKAVDVIKFMFALGGGSPTWFALALVPALLCQVGKRSLLKSDTYM